ncbi:hypothetical protein predicted by Glimmer/Critica [Streptococcus dysgalactiae subsp. equisimilis AC-2713]|uniref:Uncharacterized protein n=1 Tax=Streptococcus dysgalactiae subsp. equisimilis AC-2713 TaxID=759913 RepID=A0AB33R5T4_STREQ|nr:hypothetical protein predicted by Glimmer/Critica [Streptococcus dysgalactiae subsp. equisimilis AC-2713]
MSPSFFNHVNFIILKAPIQEKGKPVKEHFLATKKS